jgi:hypothetical protein
MLALRKDETLVHLSSSVVVATVLKVPVPRALGLCIVEVEFQVDRALKGQRSRGLLRVPVPYLVSPSGILPSFNFPPFSPGERYAIFLSPRDVPLEFVHLRGLSGEGVRSIEGVTDLRPLLPPARVGVRDAAFGRAPVSVVCAGEPASVDVRHEAHLVIENGPEGIHAHELREELGSAAAMWNGLGNVVVFVGPHGRFPISFSRERPLHGSGLAATDWQLDRHGTIVDARITIYEANEGGPIPWSVDTQPGAFDLRSTVAHEIGHVLGLRHSSRIGDLMEGSAARKGLRRSMTEGDRERMAAIYPFGQSLRAARLEHAGARLVRLANELRTLEDDRAGPHAR